MENIKYVIIDKRMKTVLSIPKLMNKSIKIYDAFVNFKFDNVDIAKCSYPNIKKARTVRKKAIEKYVEFFIDNEDYRRLVGYENKTNQEYLDYILEIAEKRFVIKQLKCSYEILDSYDYS